VVTLGALRLQSEMPLESQLPLYKCHKQVRAVKIGSITPDTTPTGATIVPDDRSFGAFHVDAVYLAKHKPHNGGYFVVYADGYQSFSPAKAFEEGYTRV
jgi:hypothetical protein